MTPDKPHAAAIAIALARNPLSHFPGFIVGSARRKACRITTLAEFTTNTMENQIKIKTCSITPHKA